MFMATQQHAATASNSWAPYRPTADAPWNLRRVVHLSRRAAFGATWREIERDLSEGPESSVTRLLAGKARLDGVPEDFGPLADVIGQAAVDSGSAGRLKAWWLYRCLFSPHPLQERLTLMWHNHFATSNLKVNDLALMKGQNDLLRRLAFSRFGELIQQLVHDPALLQFLDAPSNRRGQPNENLARELLELFTLGIGNYSEDDVKNSALALTGWTVRQGQFSDQPAAHDDGEKTILGKAGPWSGDELVTILVEHPATARRLAWRLANEFCGEGVVEEAALDELAEGLRQRNLDVGWGVETILRSELFFRDANIGTRVSDPVSFLLHPLVALEFGRDPPSTLVLAEWVSRMGQDLFHPPNVGGWPDGRAWLSTRTVVARTNYVAALVAGGLGSPPQPPDLDSLIAQNGGRRGVVESTKFLSQLLFGFVDGESVEKTAAEDGKPQLASALVGLLTGPQAHLQ